jgi:hypothetical protein
VNQRDISLEKSGLTIILPSSGAGGWRGGAGDGAALDDVDAL